MSESTPQDAAPVGIDISPLNVIGTAQSLFMMAMTTKSPMDKDLANQAKAAAGIAMGQMRIAVDEKNGTEDAEAKRLIAEALSNISGNPFETTPIQGVAQEVTPAPSLTSSIVPSLTLEAEATSTGIGSPSIEELMDDDE